MNDLISRDDAIKAFEEEKQKAKDIRDDFAKLPDSWIEQEFYVHEERAWAKAIRIVKEMNSAVMYPQVDGVTVTVVDSWKNRRKNKWS